MTAKQKVKSMLRSDAIHHIGITVYDIDKSIEFYTEVLGGEYVLALKDMTGEYMQNMLFQNEALQARAKGLEPEDLHVLNLRDDKQRLDVHFIHFGHVCIELCHYHEAGSLKTVEAHHRYSVPCMVGNMHISFYVRPDADMNELVATIEEECRRRNIDCVRFNKEIRVENEAHRLEIAKLKKHNSHQVHDGDFQGGFVYLKGPNGEQLEFNQVRGPAAHQFEAAQQRFLR